MCQLTRAKGSTSDPSIMQSRNGPPLCFSACRPAHSSYEALFCQEGCHLVWLGLPLHMRLATAAFVSLCKPPAKEADCFDWAESCCTCAPQLATCRTAFPMRVHTSSQGARNDQSLIRCLPTFGLHRLQAKRHNTDHLRYGIASQELCFAWRRMHLVLGVR